MSPYPPAHREGIADHQNVTIDGTSKKATLPANPSLLVVATLTGIWTDPEGDPTARAMLDIEFWKDRERLDVYPFKADARFLIPVGTTHLILAPMGEFPPNTKVTIALDPLPKDASIDTVAALGAAGRKAANRFLMPIRKVERVEDF